MRFFGVFQIQKLFLFIVFFAPILHLISLLHIDKRIAVYLWFLVFYPVMFILLLFFFINCRSCKIFSPPVVVLYIGIAVGIFSTVIEGRVNQEVASRLGFMFLMLLVVIWASSVNIGRYACYLFLKRIGEYAFWGVLLSVLSMWVFYYAGWDVYFGLSTEYMLIYLILILFSIPEFNIKFRLIKFIVVMALFFLGGKRGQLVAALAIVLIWLIYYVVILRNRKAFAYLSSIIIVVVVMGFLYAKIISPGEILEGYLSRFNLSEIYFDDFEGVNKFLSGRLDEVVVAIDEILESPKNIILGVGLSAYYELYGYEKSTVHISPLAVAWIYGIPYSFLLYFSLFLWLFVLFIRSNCIFHKVLVVAAFSQILVTFSVYTIFMNPVLWMLLGFLSNESIKRESCNGI